MIMFLVWDLSCLFNDLFMNPQERAGRMFFRYVKKKDSETFRRSYNRNQPLNATGTIPREPKTPAPAPSTPASKRTHPSPSPPANARTGKPLSSPGPANKQARSSGINAGLIEISDEIKQDPKKYVAAAEKAMRSCMLSLTTTTSSALEIQENVATQSDWEWLQHTDYYAQFKDALKKINEYKKKAPLLKALLLADQFGVKSS